MKKGMREGRYCLRKRPLSANYVLEGASDPTVTKPKKHGGWDTLFFVKTNRDQNKRWIDFSIFGFSLLGSRTMVVGEQREGTTQKGDRIRATKRKRRIKENSIKGSRPQRVRYK